MKRSGLAKSLIDAKERFERENARLRDLEVENARLRRELADAEERIDDLREEIADFELYADGAEDHT